MRSRPSSKTPSSASPYIEGAKNGDYAFSGERPGSKFGGHNTTTERAERDFWYAYECRLPLPGLDRRLVLPTEEELAVAVTGALEYRVIRGRWGRRALRLSNIS